MEQTINYKSGINYTRPRKNSKRAEKLNLELVKRLFEMFINDFGAVETTKPDNKYNRTVLLQTNYGRLEFTAKVYFDGELFIADDAVWVFGRFLDIDLPGNEKELSHYGVSANGKWNHYIYLDKATVDSKFEFYRKSLSCFKGIQVGA